MSDSKFQPGTLVRDNRSRVGKVVGVAGSLEVDGDIVERVAVDFWGGEERRPESWLTPLDEESPEVLLWEQHAELKPWVEDAPLRLVALALLVDGSSGEMSHIREKLDGRVLEEGQWENWWKKRQQQIRKSPEHFSVAKTGNKTVYTLRSDLDKVPPGATGKKPAAKGTASKKRPANKSVWVEWFVSEIDEPPPGATGYPTKAAFDALSSLADKETRKTLTKLLHWTDKSLSGSETELPDKKAAFAWRDLLASATLSWRDYAKQGYRDDLSVQTAELLSQMAVILGYDKATPDLMRLTRSLVLDAFGTADVSAAQQSNPSLLGYLSADEKNRLVTEMLETSGNDSRRQADELEDLRKAHKDELGKLVSSHETVLRQMRKDHDAELTKKNDELDEERREKEYWKQLVRQRNADLAARREESRLEARRDMLLVIGEVLQSLRGQDSEEELIADIEAGLRLALKAGGAELFDTAPNGFDAHLHQTTERLIDSTPVKVVAPGVKVPGKIHGDLVLLKAHVKREAS